MIYSPYGLMRYNDSNAIVDDMPLLSQWMKKFQVRRLGIFWARVHGKDAYSKVFSIGELNSNLMIFIPNSSSNCSFVNLVF